MKFSKLQVAKLLSTTPNVMASGGEIVQFFHSPQFNIDEENEGNIIEDYISFSKQLDADIIEFNNFSINDTFLKNTPFTTTKVPKKVQKWMDDEWEELLKYLDEYKELDSLKDIHIFTE